MLDSFIVQNVLGLYKFNHLFPASSRLALKYTALVQLPFLHNYHQSNQLIRIAHIRKIRTYLFLGHNPR